MFYKDVFGKISQNSQNSFHKKFCKALPEDYF